jgi:hypothetical protein
MTFFKHCYWPELHKCGVLGLPKTQGAANALREYRRDDLVLVAQTKNIHGDYSGKIFGICTLLGLTGSTKELGNPDAITADDNEMWRECLVIDKYWHIEPIEYGAFGEAFAEQVMHNQGKLFPITDDTKVISWLSKIKREEEPAVYRAQRTIEYIQKLNIK